MTAVLLSVHVLGSIVLIGPMTVAASVFPRYARAAVGTGTESGGTGTGVGQERGAAGPTAVARAMHRITRVYAVPALVVPVFGIAVAARIAALGQAWLWVSMVLTALAAVLLVVQIVPGQRRVLDALTGPRVATASTVPAATLSRLAMTTGLFALTWAVVVVLMIVRPGSTTGVGL